MVSTTILISRSSDNNDDSANQASSSTHHSYGTRTRKNIRPSTRLRQSPESSAPHRRLKLFSNTRARPGSLPQTSNFPIFPPPNVMLHSEDANNKVLMAIGRSFLSVDNRAMTIKDLAEMCMNFGLFCQSASAAGQAITSFIRSHMQRCEIEQDQPLLLKHVLSGTPCDDDLVSALHSRSGGAHCTLANAESRLTNFRRGTMIWYLSKAAGAPCPFARAGIRLCDYKEGGDIKEEQQCGQKRKRFLRARSKDRGGSDSEDIISDAETRPPKVTLTLRLKPPRVLAVMSTPSSTSGSGSCTSSSGQRAASVIDLSKDSDGDSMSVDESDDDDDPQSACKQEESIFPPYPRQSISIPVYTPSIEDLYPELFTPAKYLPPGRRSPSVPRSIASPPPDSDEDEDFPNSFRTRRRHSSARLRSKNDLDRDFGEGEDDFEVGTRYESPGPRSPWTPFAEDGGVIIKEEPTDVGGILEAWEHIDNASSSNLAAFLDHSSFDSEPGVKSEEYSFWDWNGFDRSESEANSNTTDTDSVIIKEEDVDNAIVLSAQGVSDDGSSMLGPLSAVEPSYHADHRLLTDIRRHSEVLWKDVELLGPDSVRLQDFEEGHWPRICPTRTRAHTSPSLFAPVIGSTSDTKDSRSPKRESSEPITSTDRKVVEPSMEKPDPTVVHTIRHVTPAICVAQVDGVSIYQLIVDSHPLLRRFDTDFVNLSRIAEYLGQPRSSLESISISKDVVEGCPLIRGKWVPLERARSFVHDFLTIHNVLDIFLSEKLFDQFPPCVQALHRSHHHLRSCNQFGPPFRSMVEDSRSLISIDDLFEASTSWERDDDDHLISVHPSLGIKSMDIPVPALQEENGVPDIPLSPTEQEIFHSFCGSPEWDSPTPVITDIVTDSGKENEDIRPTEERCSRGVRARTLRRSKRVADAMASLSRTRSGKTRGTLP